MKRFCRTYTINDNETELYAFCYAENEHEAENNFEHDFQSTDEKEYHWTSSPFEVKK